MSEGTQASPWKDRAVWSRIFFVALFLLILSLIVLPLVAVLAGVQALFTIFTGADNRNLRGLAAALAEYVREILLFASWNSGRRPFPFSEFPGVAMEEDEAAAGEEDDAAPGPASADARESVDAAAPKERAGKSARGKSSTGKAAADGPGD